MIKLKLKFKINDILVNFLDEKTGKTFYSLDEPTPLKKETYSIYFVCDECDKKSIWKTKPSKEYLLKDNFLCRTCKQIGEKNHQFGKKWDEKKRLEKSDSMKGEKNHFFGKDLYQVWSNKYDEETRNLLIKEHKEKSKRIGPNNGMFGKSFYGVWLDKYGEEKANLLYKNHINKLILSTNTKEHKDKMRDLMIERLSKGLYKKTSIEIKVEKYLKTLNIDFKYNFILDKKYQFDFLLNDKNLIIETHGDYWHANPTIYSNTDMNKKNLNERQEYKINLDQIKKEYAEDKKYSIIYLWETEINNNEFIKILKKYGIY